MSAVNLAVKYLTGQATVAAVVSTRIYPYVLPQNAAPPCISVRLIGQELRADLDGDHGPRFARVMVECMTTNPPATESLAEIVSAALRSKRDQTVVLTTGTFKVAFFHGGNDTSDYDDGRTIFRRSTEYDVIWQPA